MNSSLFDRAVEAAQAVDLARASVGFIAGVTAVELFLSLRQRRNYHISERPSGLAGIADEDTFQRSQRYNLDRNTHGIASLLFSGVSSAALIASGALPRIYGAVCNAVEGDLARGLLFTGATVLVSMVTSLPSSLWSTFVVEARHGFNKTTLGTFVMDRVKMIGLMCVIGPPVLGGVHWIATRAGPLFWLHTWGFVFAVSIVTTLLAPSLIMPLFNDYTPVPEGSLRDKVYGLAKSLGYPLGELYVMDGSKRSAHSNAFLFGLGSTKRIVLFDTLESQVGEEGIVSILAHELGHWVHYDTYRGLIAGQLHNLLFFYSFGLCASSARMFSDFGFSLGTVADASRAPLVSIVLFSYLYAPLESLFTFGFNAMTRRMEYAADRFAAVEVGRAEGLKSALVALHSENLSSMIVDPLYSAFHHSHPTLPERLRAIDQAVAEAKLKKE